MKECSTERGEEIRERGEEAENNKQY